MGIQGIKKKAVSKYYKKITVPNWLGSVFELEKDNNQQMKIVMGGMAGIKGKENMNGKAVYDRL